MLLLLVLSWSLEPSTFMNEYAQVPEARDSFKLLSIYFDLCVVVCCLVFSALISKPSAIVALSRLSTNFVSSSSSTVKQSMSSAQRRLVFASSADSAFMIV